VKDLKNQLSEKTLELETSKKNVKSSKILELETEIKVFSDECTRLRHHLSEVLKQQGTSIEVSSLILEKTIQNSMNNENIRKENQDLQIKLEEMRLEKESLSLKLVEKRRVKRKNEVNPKTEINKLKLIIEKITKEKEETENEKNAEINDLKKVMVEYQAELKSAGRTIQELQAKVEDLQGQISSNKKQIPVESSSKSKKSLKNSDPPKIFRILNSVVSSKKMILGVLLTLIDKNNTGLLDVEEFLKRTRAYHPGLRKKHLEPVLGKVTTSSGLIDLSLLEEQYDLFTYESCEKEISSDSSEEKENQPSHSKKVPSVVKSIPCESSKTTEPDSQSETTPNLLKSSEVSKSSNFSFALQHVFFRLQLNRIPEKSLFNLLFPFDDEKLQLNSADLCEIMKHAPFNLTEAENLNDLIAGFSVPLTPGQFIVTLVDLLPPWEIFSEVEERVLDQQLNQIISSHFEVLSKACSLVDRKKKLFLTVDEFFAVFRTLSIALDEKMKSYVKLLLYSYDMQLDVAPYNHFLQIYRKIQISNEERALIVRSYLTRIADVLRKNKITAVDVFCTNDLNVISEEYFFEGLERLGIFNVPSEHVEVILEALQCEGDELGISLDELSDILAHYGVVQNQTITEESRSLYSSFESEKGELSQIDESEDQDYSESYEQQEAD
jgi:hypothetical protein